MKNTFKNTLLGLAVCLSLTTGVFADTYVNTTVDNKTSVITVSGKIDGEKNSMAAVYVLQGDVTSLGGITSQNAIDYINHAEQFVTDENGEFKFTYKLSGDAGKYKVFLSNADGSKKAETQFGYISYEELEKHIKTIETNRDPENKNNDLAQRTAEIKKVLTNDLVLSAFGIIESDLPLEFKLTDIDDEIFEYIAQSNSECLDKEDIKDIVHSSLTAKAFNASQTDGYEKILDECSDILNINDKIYEIYKASSDIKTYVDDVLSIEKIISAEDIADTLTEHVVLSKYKSMTHYSEFMRFMEETDNVANLDLILYNTITAPHDATNVDKAMLACKNTIDSLEKLQDEFKAQIQTELNRVIVDNSDNGGGKGSGGGRGGSGTSLGASIGMGTEILAGNKAVFYDIAGVEWAKDAIEVLAEKGVISGYGDGTFRPHNNIMREEAVKIIISSFGFYDKNATSDFVDVDNSAWYAGYVASAQKLGLISGMGDGSFGIGNSISRQDMAVIINNISKLFGNTYPAKREYVGFADETNISDYAKDAVKNLYCAGILNGNNLNEFNPAQSLTRAEMAKIMSAVLDITK